MRPPIYHALVAVISLLRDYPTNRDALSDDELANERRGMKGAAWLLGRYAAGRRDPVFNDGDYLVPLVEHFGADWPSDALEAGHDVDVVLAGLIDAAVECHSRPGDRTPVLSGFFRGLQSIRTQLGPSASAATESIEEPCGWKTSLSL